MFDPSKENKSESQSAPDGGTYSSGAPIIRGIVPTSKSTVPSTVRLSPYSVNPRATGVVIFLGGVVSLLGYQGMLVWLNANNFEFVIFGVIGLVLGTAYMVAPNLMVEIERAWVVAKAKPNFNRNRNIIIFVMVLCAVLYGWFNGTTTEKSDATRQAAPEAK